MNNSAIEMAARPVEAWKLTVITRLFQGKGEFTKRSKLTYTGPKLVTAKSKRHVSVQLEQVSISAADVAKMQKLIDDGDLYRVQIPSNVNDPNSPKVMASIPACLLASSNFHEIFRIHVDQYGNIRGLWYQTISSECAKDLPKLPQKSIQLVTSVIVDMDSKGPKLAMEPQVRTPENEAEGQKQNQQQTFFQKYWMYIAGGILLVSLLPADDDKRGPGAGQGRPAAGPRPR
jgi:hypothetical protein